MTAILVNNLLREEDIARQRSPLNNFIFDKLHKMFEASCDKDSVSNLLFGLVALRHYIGHCLSKYVQTTQDKVNLHTHLSGTTVIVAFVANNFVFYNNKKAPSRN